MAFNIFYDCPFLGDKQATSVVRRSAADARVKSQWPIYLNCSIVARLNQQRRGNKFARLFNVAGCFMHF